MGSCSSKISWIPWILANRSQQHYSVKLRELVKVVGLIPELPLHEDFAGVRGYFKTQNPFSLETFLNQYALFLRCLFCVLRSTNKKPYLFLYPLIHEKLSISDHM